jgi:hypothetical protein
LDDIAGAFVEIGSGDRIFLFPGNPSDFLFFDVPNGQNATGLSETSLLLDTTDALLQDGGDLGGLGLGLGGVGANLLGGTGEGAGNSRADLEREREKLVNGALFEPTCDEAILNGCSKGRDGIRGPIELEFEMEKVGQGEMEMAMEDEDGQDGLDSPKRHGQWPRRRGWTAAERS